MDWLGRNPLPSLVISDLMMPEMTGVDLLRRLRSDPRTAELPVIIFSAAADGPLHDKALEAGANAFWTKGRVDFASLRQLIDSHSRPVVALES
jgi:CheY-like chemotaxis protein